MRKAFGLVFVGILMVGAQAEMVPAQLISLSPQILPAVDRDRLTRVDYRMSISAFPNPASVNHELVLAAGDSHDFSHEGFFLLEDGQLFETFSIAFVLDVPAFADVNTNGVHDFYDPVAAVENVRTTGFHSVGDDAAEFSATWARPAGSTSGTVLIEMPFLGRTFTHTMSILAFEGGYDFTRAGTNLTGTVAVTNRLDTNEVITGPFSAAVANTNTITYRGGTWQGAGDFPYTFAPLDTLERSASSFVSVLVFEDGFPGTPEADYPVWLLVLSSGDANGNGVLDLVEGTTGGEAPQLSIRKVTGGVEITVRGSPGKSYALQGAMALPSASWTKVQTVSPGSGGSATVTMASGDGARFFRLQEE